MSVMGNRWAFALLVASFVGMSRFTDFQTQLGTPPGSLADRLSIFTANGVLVVSDGAISADREGQGVLSRPDQRPAMGAAIIPAPEGPAVMITHSAAAAGSTRCWYAINARARSRRAGGNRLVQLSRKIFRGDLAIGVDEDFSDFTPVGPLV